MSGIKKNPKIPPKTVLPNSIIKKGGTYTLIPGMKNPPPPPPKKK